MAVRFSVYLIKIYLMHNIAEIFFIVKIVKNDAIVTLEIKK